MLFFSANRLTGTIDRHDNVLTCFQNVVPPNQVRDCVRNFSGQEVDGRRHFGDVVVKSASVREE